MKIYQVLMFILLAALLQAQQSVKTDTKVTSATVFSSGAMITREGKVVLPAGLHAVVISNLPEDIADETVNVTFGAYSPVTLLSVHTEKRVKIIYQKDEISSFKKQARVLEEKLHAEEDKLTRLQIQHAITANLKPQPEKLLSSKSVIGTASMKHFDDILNFVEENLQALQPQIQAANNDIAQLKKDIDSVQAKLSKFSSGTKTTRKEIIAKVQVQSKGEYVMSTQYLLKNASWQPKYETRINSKESVAQQEYLAEVKQNTGEDWKNISLSLSTGTPTNIKRLPLLFPLFIDTRPIPEQRNETHKEQFDYFDNNYEPNYGLPIRKGMLKGIVLDRTTGEPLIGVHIAIRGTLLGSVTDADGEFTILKIPEGNKELQCNFVGYSTLTRNILVKSQHTLHICLYMDAMAFNSAAVIEAKRELINSSVTNSNAILSQGTIPIQTGVVHQIRGGRTDALGFYVDGVAVTDALYAGTAGVVADFNRKYEPESPYYNERIDATVNIKATSTVFDIKDKLNIDGNNTSQTISIADAEYPAKLEYLSVPGSASGVFMKAVFKNANNFPWLAGTQSVSLGDEFRGKFSAPVIVPGDSLKLGLGKIDGVQCEKKLIKRYTESGSIFNSLAKQVFIYEISIVNTLSYPVTVTILDQVPIPARKEILVELIEPVKPKYDQLKDNILTWNHKFEPGEKQVYRVHFTITHPANIQLGGLQ